MASDAVLTGIGREGVRHVDSPISPRIATTARLDREEPFDAGQGRLHREARDGRKMNMNRPSMLTLLDYLYDVCTVSHITQRITVRYLT